MLSRADLSHEHGELETLANKILHHVDRPAPDLETLSTLRWRLNRILLVHLAKEDKLLYPQLQRSRRPDVCSLATQFADEMGGLAKAFTDYVVEWPIQRAMADWSGFGASTRAVLAALRDRIHREETQLYPLIADAA